LKERLLQAERLALLGELSAGIAHEIRNPLAAININLQFLRRTLNTDLLQERKIVETALVGVERIDGIVSATLNFAKPARPVFKPQNINDIIRVTVPLAKVSMEKKNAKVVLALEDNLPLISVDFKQIQQVIVNLLTNAADAIHGKGEIVIQSQHAVMVNDQPGVCVSMADNGEGMSKDEMKKIFEPFFTKKASGTGLGLSISQQILSFHKATIDVSSEPGKGTTFRIVFPSIVNVPEENNSEISNIAR
jgi:signal transduction histidine kinase